MRINLSKTVIENIVQKSKIPTKRIFELYKHVIPNWDNVEKINHFPQVNKETSIFIMNSLSKDLTDKEKQILMMIWVNNGFGCIKKDVPEWVVDIEEDKIIYKEKINDN